MLDAETQTDDAPPPPSEGGAYADKHERANLLRRVSELEALLAQTDGGAVHIVYAEKNIEEDDSGNSTPPGRPYDTVRNATIGGGPPPFGLRPDISPGGSLSVPSISAMQKAVKSRLKVAFDGLATLSDTALAADLTPQSEVERLDTYLSLRYAAGVASLLAILCRLAPRQEYLPLFDAVRTFVVVATQDGRPQPLPSSAAQEEETSEETTTRAALPPMRADALGHAALLREINALCATLRPSRPSMNPPGGGSSPAAILVALQRAVGAMRTELRPLVATSGVERAGAAEAPYALPASLDGRGGHDGQPTRSVSTPLLLSPHLRSRGTRGGGGGSNVGLVGLSCQQRPWLSQAALPTAPRTPSWLARNKDYVPQPQGLPRFVARPIGTARDKRF